MTTKRRIAVTAAAGVVLGVATLVNESAGFPTADANDAIATPFLIFATITLFVAPLIVARWWAIAAVAGPALALLILQAADVSVSLDDGTGPAWNYRTIFFLAIVATILAVVGTIGQQLSSRGSARTQREWREALSRNPDS